MSWAYIQSKAESFPISLSLFCSEVPHSAMLLQMLHTIHDSIPGLSLHPSPGTGCSSDPEGQKGCSPVLCSLRLRETTEQDIKGKKRIIKCCSFQFSETSNFLQPCAALEPVTLEKVFQPSVRLSK